MEKWASVPGPLFCGRTDVGAGTQNFGPKRFFSPKPPPPLPHMCSQNDQRDVGITLSHRSWRGPPPPPARGTAGGAPPRPEPPTLPDKERGIQYASNTPTFYISWNARGGGGGQGQSNDPRNNQHNPQYANYWAPLARKRHIPAHPAQPWHTNDWAPRTRKRHQQEHRPQRPTERSDPTQHAKGRTGDCPGPRKGATTRRNVTRGGGGSPYAILFPCFVLGLWWPQDLLFSSGGQACGLV